MNRITATPLLLFLLILLPGPASASFSTATTATRTTTRRLGAVSADLPTATTATRTTTRRLGTVSADLPFSASVSRLTASDFAPPACLSTVPIIVDFYAPWCPHCQHFAPTYSTTADMYEGALIFAAVNCEDFPDLCAAQGIAGYPTLRAMKEGLCLTGNESTFTGNSEHMGELWAWVEANGGKRGGGVVPPATGITKTKVRGRGQEEDEERAVGDVASS